MFLLYFDLSMAVFTSNEIIFAKVAFKLLLTVGLDEKCSQPAKR
jgi:hypothetical protein